MADKQTSKELQAVLDKVENVQLRLVFSDLHSLIKVCFQMIGVHSVLSGATPQLDFQTLMQKAIEANNVLERKYIDTWAKVHDAQVKEFGYKKQRVMNNKVREYIWIKK